MRHQLLLSNEEPHKPVVSCSISGWLVKVLGEAIIDTNKFKAHSTRGASTSKESTKGLACKDILEMG